MSANTMSFPNFEAFAAEVTRRAGVKLDWAREGERLPLRCSHIKARAGSMDVLITRYEKEHRPGHWEDVHTYVAAYDFEQKRFINVNFKQQKTIEIAARQPKVPMTLGNVQFADGPGLVGMCKVWRMFTVTSSSGYYNEVLP